MSDDFITPQSDTSPPSIDMPAKKPGLLSSTGGKIVAILVGLGTVAILVGIVALIVLYVLNPSGQDMQQLVEQAPQGGTTSGQASGESTTSPGAAGAPATPAAPIGNKAVFTFRDIFNPLLKELPEKTTTSGGGSKTDTETPTAKNVLYVTDIVTEDGERKVVCTLDGKTYTLAEGEGIPGTPWKVLRITDTRVTFLYGDVPVNLAVGQGITK